jgi:hypothetical protein
LALGLHADREQIVYLKAKEYHTQRKPIVIMQKKEYHTASAADANKEKIELDL